MSLLRWLGLRSKAASRNTVRNRVRREAGRARPGRKPRRLFLDPLEERMLLTLAPLETVDTLVNTPATQVQIGTQMYTDTATGTKVPEYIGLTMVNSLPGTTLNNSLGFYATSSVTGQPVPITGIGPTTISGQSLASDRQGDYVVTWARSDTVEELSVNQMDGSVVRDASGNPVYHAIVDPLSRLPVTDNNIYARYFTDTVQRITLPQQILADNSPSRFGSFSLRAGGNEVQTLSITAGYEPNMGMVGTLSSLVSQPLLDGSFTLGFDVNGSTTIGPGETTTIFFNEANFASTDPTLNPAKILQTQLQSLGGDLKDVTVVGIDPHDYEIDFGNASAGKYEPAIQLMPGTMNFFASPNSLYPSPAFLPAVTQQTSTNPLTGFQVTGLPITRQPIDIPNIPVSPTDPSLTATAIKTFLQADASLSVDVTPVLGLPGYTDGTVFDVRFTGALSKMDVPLMVVTAAADDALPANSLMGSPQLSIRTTKGPSSEFRVNNEDTPNPFVAGAPFYLQATAPAVAMDADGNFAITWQSTVPDWMVPGSKSDIYARRFTPQAMVDPSSAWVDGNGNMTQSVRPLGDQFRVNTFVTDAQTTPAIAMDNEGDFAIAWANVGVSASYFNGIFAQRFDMNGVKLSSEFEVNTYNTNNHVAPRVALSENGLMLVGWQEWWPNTPFPTATTARLNAQLYAAPDSHGASAVLLNPGQIALPGNGTDITETFNANDEFLITWTVTTLGAQDNDGVAGNANQSTGVWARMFRRDGTLVRDTFRANSPNFSTASQPSWPLDQYGGQAGMDANGDVYISYNGYGPDMDGWVMANHSQLPADVDYEIEQYLLPYAQPVSSGGMGYTNDQLAQLRLMLENMYASEPLPQTVARGAANDVMFAGFSAAAGTGDVLNVTASDNSTYPDATDNGNLLPGQIAVLNATRDGHNAQYYIAFDGTTGSGTFILRLWHNGSLDQPYYGGFQDTAAITWANNNNVPNLTQIANNIDDAISALSFVGDAYQSTAPVGEDGPISVRYVDPLEVQERQGTPWALTDTGLPYGLGTTTILPSQYVFEITFQGSAHDQDMTLAVQTNSLKSTGTSEVQVLTFSPQSLLFPDGYFYILIGTQQTPDIYFSSANPAATAAAIQAAIAAINTAIPPAAPAYAYAGVLVTVIPGGPPYQFQVVFPRAAGNVPPIQLISDPASALPFFGNLFSTTVTDGGSTTAPAPLLLAYQYGDMGTMQEQASSGVTAQGSLVAAWQQDDQYTDGSVADHNIYCRQWQENTDNVGPIVTDMTYGTSDQSIPNNGLVTQNLQYLVVDFDENLMTTGGAAGPHSVLNPNNWTLTKDGVNIKGAIRGIQFGMNKAQDLASVLPLDPVGSNKWEAVIEFDGNGLATGVPPLANGYYQLVALPQIEDAVGNALSRTGFTLGQGVAFTRNFTILVASNGEVRVNADPAGGHFTYDASNMGSDPGSQAVASDPNGDYVVTWQSTNPNAPGLYAKLYQVTWTADATGTRQSSIAQVVVPPWPNNEILVTNDTTAMHPAVARDGDGDFVVTWSQENSDPTVSWDVYARRYTAAGAPLGSAFLVNTETTGFQRYSAIAMDPEGDFTITWQSLNQDGSGYGVYAQRFTPSGVPVGGTDEEQLINFKSDPRGTFTLTWDANHDGIIEQSEQTVPITYSGSTLATAQAIQSALDAIQEARDGLYLGDIVVQAVSANQILVRFTGKDGSQDQPQMVVLHGTLTGGTGANIFATTSTDGVPGEFRVNDTTLGDQMWPSIAMDAQGAFAISWTSFGQGTDQPYQGNVYLKHFLSNISLLGASTVDRAYSTVFAPRFANSAGTYKVVTSGLQNDTPAAHVVAPGQGADGVVQVQVLVPGGVDLGTGSLLVEGGGRYILTAAHVVGNLATGLAYPAANVSVVFNMPTGDVTIGVSQVFINPTWNPLPGQGGDIALIVLSSPAPAAAQRFDIYRTTDELFKIASIYGYGLSGVGLTGENPVLDPYGTKRWGENVYEATGTALGFAPDLLAYDFDDGTDAHDALGQVLGIHNTGLGPALEVNSARGDSGGPIFINGLIAAVTSFGFGAPILTTDVTAVTDSSFGEISCDTRVSTYATWIDQITSGATAETLVNQFTTGTQQWSAVAMDEAGDFVVTWTSYNQDAAGGLNGVFARRFNANAQPVGNAFVVNSYTSDNQQHPRVAMDANGDFTIAWESYQDPVQPTDPPTANATYGIYAQRYVRPALIGTSPFIGVNGELGGEFPVNGTVAGDQRFPSVAMDHAGDFLIVWNGNGTVPGQADPQGVFYNRYEAPSDTAGPIVADTLRVQADSPTANSLWLVRNGSFVSTSVPKIIVDFDENLWTKGGVTGLDSVLNPSNWEIDRNGIPMTGTIASVDFGLNKAYADGLEATPSGKYEAVIAFDSDPSTSALEPLGGGDYTLTIHDTVWDLFKNRLDGNYDGIPGGDFHRTFTILSSIPGGPSTPGVPNPPGDPGPNSSDPTVPNPPPVNRADSPVVASDANGNYIVVWVAYGEGGDIPTDGNIVAQRFNSAGQRQGAEFTVNSVTAGSQVQPDVAMDPNGDFVIVWSGPGQGDTTGIFGRSFDSFGVSTKEFKVNEYTLNVQDTPSVAMDPNGDFVVTWNSYNSAATTPDRYGVWARRYNNLSQPQPISGPTEIVNPPAGLNPGVLVNAASSTVQASADVAMDGNGNFTIVWQSDGQDGSSWGIYGQQFNADGSRKGNEFPVNTFTQNAQIEARIAMDPMGDFVVAWSSFAQDGNGYGVYARRYDAVQQAMGPEFRVNENTIESSNKWTTAYWQYQPAVAMAANGTFVVTWTTGGQRSDANDFDIHARMYDTGLNSAGLPPNFVNPATGVPWGEFRINAVTLGDQVTSDVAMDIAGNFVTVWAGPDPTIPLITSNVFDRVVHIGDPTTSGTVTSSTSLEGWSGGWSTADGGIAPTSQMLIGTAGNDVLNITLGQTPSTWPVQLNGVTQRIGGSVSLVGFDGNGGNDTVNITGTAAAVKIEVWPDHTIFTGNGFTFTTANAGTINFTGVSGTDQVIFHDSGSGDTFTFHAGAQPGASLTGTGYALNVANVSKVQALAASGNNNAAQLYGASGTNNFIGAPTYAIMSPADGSGSYSVTATGFDAVRAYAGSSGKDMANLYDDPNSSETFVADSASATLSSPTYSRQVNGFRYVIATSSGGADTATLRDSAGNDTFNAYPNSYAEMYSNAFYIQAKAFKTVEGQSRQGTDLARLYGTGQSDQFTGSPTYGHLTGTGYDLGARNFRYVMAYSNGGPDSATLYPSSGTDTYVGTSSYGVLYSTSYYDRALGFPRVEVDATPGNTNSARLYDSTGVDSFTAAPTSASLIDPSSGAGHVVKNVRYVSAYSTTGGTGTATLTAAAGSTGGNTLDAYPTYASLSGTAGSGYYNLAVGFSSVTATSLGNTNDIARLHDSPGNDTFTAYPTTATLSGTGFSEQANSFRNVYAYSQSGGTDIANLYGSNGDDTFFGTPTYGMLFGATYLNRANNFAEVHAFAGAGGTDTAKLFDSAGNDYFWGHATDAVLSDGTLDNTSGNLVTPKTYYNRISGFGSTTVDGTAGGTNNRKILTPTDYALAFTGTWLGDPWP